MPGWEGKTKGKISQTTLIINFKQIEKEKCRELEIDPKTNEIVDSLYPTFFVEGITNVFKRFFFGHCHLQILFVIIKFFLFFIIFYFLFFIFYFLFFTFYFLFFILYFIFFFLQKENELGEEISKNFKEKKEIPWTLILKISNLIFKDKFSSIQELIENVETSSSNAPIVSIFDISIKKVAKTSFSFYNEKTQKFKIL